MERILQSFKNLYTGENIVRKHLLFSLLLILPALTCALAGYIDKETPKAALLVLAVAALVFGLISIFPLVCTLGFYIDFCKDRLNGVVGIPEINWQMFVKGLKVLPLSIVWAFYMITVCLLLLFGPIAPLIHSMIVSKAAPSVTMILASIGLFMLCGLLVLAFIILVIPFTSYIYFEYIKQGKMNSKLFNPLVLVDYMKKAFKETIIVEFKYILAGLVVGFGAGIIQLLLGIIIFTVSFVVGVFTPEEQIDMMMYSTGIFLFVIPLSVLSVVVQSYANSMVGYAAAENYIEIYQNKIDKIQEVEE